MSRKEIIMHLTEDLYVLNHDLEKTDIDANLTDNIYYWSISAVLEAMDTLIENWKSEEEDD